MIKDKFFNISLSFTIFIFVILLSIFLFIGLFLSKNNTKQIHTSSQEILFNKIQIITSNILTTVLYQYTQNKEEIKKKHQYVLEYLKDKPIDTNLSAIYNEINGKNSEKYNIYLTDENLIIRNTTFKNDLGFDLSFAKTLFEQHKKENIIGVSAPILEASSNKFLSFSDSFLPHPYLKNILQLSYRYDGFDLNLKKLDNIINNDNVLDIKAYLYIKNDNFTADFYFKKYKDNKPTLKELENRIKLGKELSKIDDEIITKFVKIDNKNLKEIYFTQKSDIFDDAKVIYSILLDESKYLKEIEKYNIYISIVVTLFILSTILIILLNKKEEKLILQDKFVQQSLHEIKTPLSIITLNNELRSLKDGEDKHTIKIDNALKTLKNSYNDMSFVTLADENINYPKEYLKVANILKDRVEYFKSSFQVNDKRIELSINSDYSLNISIVELERLIDNNISNALKYSFNGTTTKIILENNFLSFETKSEKIEQPYKIFTKYYRENNVKGGFGLGLFIVNNISSKYNIKYEIESSDKKTIFKYIL